MSYGAAMAARKEILDVDGRDVTITNPDKVFFPKTGHTKLDLVRYYLAVADGALVGVGGRPMALKRYVDGVESEPFYQKRAPKNLPEWMETVEFRYPSGGVAHEIVVRDAAALAWVVNLGCVDLHPHPVRADDLLHPDELRVDLDPIPGVPGMYTIDTVPPRYAGTGDPGAGIDDAVGTLDTLLEMAERDKKEGLVDPPRPGSRAADPLSPTGRRQSSMPLIIVGRAASAA